MYGQYQRSFGIQSRGGAYCRGEGCGGWHLSECDCWERCLCWSGQLHPEEAMIEAELEAEADRESFEANELPARLEAPRPWHPVAVPDHDGIPF